MKSHSHSSRDQHHASNSPSPSPPPRRRGSGHRYRDGPFPIPPYYPPEYYPDYGRIPPPPYHSRFRAFPFPRRKKKHMYHLESDKRKKVHTIFMYNLSYKLTNEKLNEFCSKYGEVSEIIYPLTKLGMGFVTYYDIRDAEKAVKEMNGIELNGRILHTNFAYRPPAHSKRKPEDICANVFANIESVQNKLQALRNDKNADQEQGNDPDEKKNEDNGENEDEIDKELERFVADINITSEDIQSIVTNFGEVRSVEDYDYGVFLVKFYDIRSARKCVEAQSLQLNSQTIIFEYAPEAELGDDETNCEFSREEYYRQFRNDNNENDIEDNSNDENNGDENSKSGDYDNEPIRRRSDDRSRNRDRNRDYDNDRDRRRDHGPPPQHYRDGPGKRSYPAPPMSWYPPYPPYGPQYPPHPMGWYHPYPGEMPPPMMRKGPRDGRRENNSRRKD
ncbi:hypothetical protein M9Y10_028664 [Tritrichomonas musculus]|uniref:RRM domain-containing protein n=1 Tax=Tritrichomonas musculus TaxID=1915356 RepID=A0ABR2KNC7_9EUKA